MKVTVNGKSLRGQIPAIASKSMAHRYLILSSLCDEITGIRCENRSDDISATARCLKSMGKVLSYSEGKYYVGSGKSTYRPVLDCGESGSTLRFLLPIVCALGHEAKFIRGRRLSVRPLNALTRELCRHGCTVTESENGILCIGGKLMPGYYHLPGDISSQFISGLLMALPLCRGDSVIEIEGKPASEPYIDMTLDAQRTFGVHIEKTENGFKVPGNTKYVSPGTAEVEGDWSAASFWLCAGYLGADITVTGLDNNSFQGDKRINTELLKLRSPGKVLLDATDIPDLVPVLAVCAAVRDGQTVIYNAARLRGKESDRLSTVSKMLGSLGCRCCETEDGLKISGEVLHPGTVSACGDHRIAMAAAAASVAAGNVTVDGAEAVSKSYPAFWEDFRKLHGIVIFEDD